MTTRFKGVTVAFEQDIREDDAEGLLDAIRRLRGVLSVTPNEASSDWVAEERIRDELKKKLRDVLWGAR